MEVSISGDELTLTLIEDGSTAPSLVSQTWKGDTATSSLTGTTWRGSAGEQLIFNEDGTFRFVEFDEEVTEWQWTLDGTTLTLLSVPVTFRYALSGDSLTLTAETATFVLKKQSDG